MNNADEIFNKTILPEELGDSSVGIDDMENLNSLLVSLNKQVNNADMTVGNIAKRADELDKKESILNNERNAFETERLEYDNRVRDDFQKLNEEKASFEQEKSKIFNEIQLTRESLAKEKREFDKYRRTEIAKINQNKILLKKNYEQFNQIVEKFNRKIDNYRSDEEGNK